MKRCACRSPTPYPSNPSSSAHCARRTTCWNRSYGVNCTPLIGSGELSISV